MSGSREYSIQRPALDRDPPHDQYTESGDANRPGDRRSRREREAEQFADHAEVVRMVEKTVRTAWYTP